MVNHHEKFEDCANFPSIFSKSKMSRWLIETESSRKPSQVAVAVQGRLFLPLKLEAHKKVWFGCGPLSVTVASEGLGRDPPLELYSNIPCFYCYWKGHTKGMNRLPLGWTLGGDTFIQLYILYLLNLPINQSTMMPTTGFWDGNFPMFANKRWKPSEVLLASSFAPSWGLKRFGMCGIH